MQPSAALQPCTRTRTRRAIVVHTSVVQGESGAYECVQGNSGAYKCGAVWYRPDVVQVQTHVGISQMSL